MRRLLPLIVLMACEPMPATGDPLAPVPASSPVSVAGPAPSATPFVGEDGFDFDEDARDFDAVGGDEDLSPAALLALAQGLEPPPPSSVPTPQPEPVPVAPAPAPVQPASVPVAMQVWDPATALPPAWGVRLVSTLADTQPPRAVLGLPDGTEVVVQPGTFLPDHRLVVMAVGRNVIQVSRVVPEGYQARVETQNLSSMYPSQSLGAPN